jgi:hypothetical protein
MGGVWATGTCGAADLWTHAAAERKARSAREKEAQVRIEQSPVKTLSAEY